jgi:putative NIF3 family GTP cyclohydrolase 1 type 2
MKLSRLYDLVLEYAIEVDPRRDKSAIKGYPDTAILYGSPDRQVRKVLIGIDIETPELLLADKIRRRDGLDLVIAHHPEGKAYAALFEVMQLQVDLLHKAGLDRKTAEKFLEERKREVERRILAQNHMRSPDAAKILDLPFMCIHTPADNQVADFMLKLFQRSKPDNVEDILALLNQIPEYQEAARMNAGPRLLLGNPKRPVGKVFLEMTGGTEGPKEVYGKLYKTGVRTLVSMHLGEEHFTKVKDANLNVIIAGHISSDNLGLNLLLDKVEKEEKFVITCCSGFRRIIRS